MICGLDTVGISFPIRDADTTGATVTVVAADTPDARYTYRRRLDGGGFLAWGVGDSAWVEASLPKRVNPDNIAALSADQAVEALRDLYAEAVEHVEPVTAPKLNARPYEDKYHGRIGFAPEPIQHRGWDTAKIVRADFVRDFDGVRNVAPLLNGLSTIRQPGRHKVSRFADAERSNAETLRVGPKSWSCTLYDKHAETNGAAAPGRLRFEARLRSRQLLGKFSHKFAQPIHTVSDLTAERVHAMTAAHFSHVGFDREVSGVAQLSALINSCDDLSPRTKRELVGYLAGRAMGIELDFSPNTERRYRNLAAQLGLVLSPESLGESFTARLDFAAGTEVLAVAA